MSRRLTGTLVDEFEQVVDTSSVFEAILGSATTKDDGSFSIDYAGAEDPEKFRPRILAIDIRTKVVGRLIKRIQRQDVMDYQILIPKAQIRRCDFQVLP